MPSANIHDPKMIIFLIENYEKETRSRLNWLHKHRKQIEEAATLNREPKNYYEKDVTAHHMVEGLATITRDFVESGRHRRKKYTLEGSFIPGSGDLWHGHSIVDVGLGDPEEDPRLARSDTDVNPDPIMRPLDPEIEAIIYKSKPEYGRLQYLSKRYQVKPEKRFYFAQNVNSDYGWRLEDSVLRTRAQHGRCWHLSRFLKSTVGPQPDPKHYKSSDIPNVSKCRHA